jgi:hypothetical protein
MANRVIMREGLRMAYEPLFTEEEKKNSPVKQGIDVIYALFVVVSILALFAFFIRHGFFQAIFGLLSM